MSKIQFVVLLIFFTMEIYLAKAKKTEEEVLKYHNDKTGWTRVNDYKNVEIYHKKSPHFSGQLYRFEYTLDLPSEKLFEIMKPPANKKERLDWDKSVKDYICIENISDELRIGVFITHSALGGLISSREFLDLFYFRSQLPSLDDKYENFSWILAEAYDHPNRPVTKNFVRGQNYPTGYAVAKLKSDPSKSRMVMYVNCNIGGMIPQSLVEKAIPAEQVTYMKSLEEECRRRLNY